MAYNNYGYYDSAFVGNDEIFNHRPTPMPYRMDEDEIVEPPENGYNNHGYNNHGYNNHGYNNQVQQIYFRDDHNNYDRRDYDRNDRINRGNYVPEQIPFQMDGPELNHEISIQLTGTRIDVDKLLSTLRQDDRLGRCSVDRNDVLTITPNPGALNRSGPYDFLDLVKRISGDLGAYII